MWTGLGAALVGGGFDVLGGFLQGSSNAKAAKKQYGYALDLMNRQNAYNHPKAQMERLKEAGLNPMLVYGNGSVVGNTSSSASAPSVQPADWQSVSTGVGKSFGRFFEAKKMSQDLQLGQAQIDQAKANTAAAIQSVLNMQANAKKVDAETSSVLYNLGLAQKLGVRDGSLTTLELGRTYGSRVKDLARDVVYGHPSGKNSIVDQIKRFFE